MQLELPEPYSFELSTERYRRFGPDPAALWREGGLHRVLVGREVRIEAAPGGVRITPGDVEVVPEAERFLGAFFDLEAFYGFAAGDAVLSPIATALAGFRPPILGDPFESLVSSITAQQVSLMAALAIRIRLVERYGVKHEHAWAFPARERIAAAEPGELVALGFSNRKAEYTVGLARSDLDLDGLAGLPDDVVKERLTALPGIGDWTAEWFLARHLGRPDAWPAGDLGLRKAVGRFYLDGRDPSVEETRALGGRFTPHGNLAAHYLLTGMRVMN
jgi:3-methyladenine DNA glycosylase/8-oxoguanine DNA glycosylase